MIKGFIIITLIAVVLTSVVGCSGAHAKLVVSKALYPVSMSRALEDEKGEKISKLRIKKVGKFETQGRAWGIFYSLIPLTPRIDLSDSINKQIAQVEGNGIVNLRVSADGCLLNYISFLAILPLWPGCADFLAQGEIVKIDQP